MNEWLDVLESDFSRPPSPEPKIASLPTSNNALRKRLIDLCPCLANQTDLPVSAAGIVHLCELTLGERIDSDNVHEAFLVQHPSKGPSWKFPPAGKTPGSGGQIMELLCSEVLVSAGLPVMDVDAENWPTWQVPGHILLNQGRMNDLKGLGDILIPCAPTNLIVSVKSEKARERLLYSANSIEGVGFGFFDEAEEFTTVRRIQLLKRMGFSAIYMPAATLGEVAKRLEKEGRDIEDVQNIYGTPLYRPLNVFGTDMLRIAGKSAFDL